MMVGRNPTPGAFYPTTAGFGAITSRPAHDNESLDMNNWDSQEFHKFMKWFIEANHPEVVEQYQAVRAIERKVEWEEANRRYREQLEAEVRLRQQSLAQQQAYPYSQSPYATQSLSMAEPKPKTLWERFKEVASRPLGHGDYY
jgi:hypothetical protein